MATMEITAFNRKHDGNEFLLAYHCNYSKILCIICRLLLGPNNMKGKLTFVCIIHTTQP